MRGVSLVNLSIAETLMVVQFVVVVVVVVVRGKSQKGSVSTWKVLFEGAYYCLVKNLLVFVFFLVALAWH